MLCSQIKAGFPCGQCTPCRINAHRKKVTRILLEASSHPDASFFTLTYNDDAVPAKDGQPTLYKRDAIRFLRRLKRQAGNFSYFLAGEYGSKTGRPHFHGISSLSTSTMFTALPKAWPEETMGFHHLGTAQKAAAFYASGYVMKKMTKHTDERLNGREPEFALHSKNPALGKSAAKWIASALTTDKGSRALAEHGMIPTEIRFMQELWPLDRYMREQIAKELGMELKDTAKRSFETPVEEDRLLAVQKDDWKSYRMNRGQLKANRL